MDAAERVPFIPLKFQSLQTREDAECEFSLSAPGCALDSWEKVLDRRWSV